MSDTAIYEIATSIRGHRIGGVWSVTVVSRTGRRYTGEERTFVLALDVAIGDMIEREYVMERADTIED